MNLQETIAQYKKIRKQIKAYEYVMGLVGWDSATEAPEMCFDKRGEYSGVLSEELYKIQTGEEFKGLIEELYNHQEELEPLLAHEIREIKRSNDKQSKIPMEEYVAYSALMASSEQVWAKAKNENDFKQFAPLLEKIVAFQKKYMKWQESDELKGYDILLDEYERGFTTKEYDEFFDLLKKELVPFVKQITSSVYPGKEDYSKLVVSSDKQKEVAKEIEKMMCFDTSRGLSKESMHPFTGGSGTYDVRYTNHFYEDNFISSIYSAVHELGHATYEQQCDPELDETFIGGGASMAMHESQSRFYENIVGRGEAFVSILLPKMNEAFGMELDEKEFFYYVNKVENSLIRTEADELTYPLHIMLRYDLERALLSDEITVEQLPQEWNRRFKEYFGIDVPSDSEGVLQDVHWSGGSFGYFPTYALGSAYAAQIYHAMSKEISVEEAIKSGSTKEINEWLKEHIHKYAASKYPKDILLEATGEEFNPHYYVDYLKEKYSAIYGLKG